MPMTDGKTKWACYSCIHGHRTKSCMHFDRPMNKVRPPGRPAKSCGNNGKASCPCTTMKGILRPTYVDEQGIQYAEIVSSWVDLPGHEHDDTSYHQHQQHQHQRQQLQQQHVQQHSQNQQQLNLAAAGGAVGGDFGSPLVQAPNAIQGLGSNGSSDQDALNFNLASLVQSASAAQMATGGQDLFSLGQQQFSGEGISPELLNGGMQMGTYMPDCAAFDLAFDEPSASLLEYCSCGPQCCCLNCIVHRNTSSL